MIRFSKRVPCCIFLLLACRYSLAADTALTELPLTEETYFAWRDHILPAETDLGWQRIPWLTTFQAGILDANERDLPLLLWTMNGHPLGCT